VWEIDVAAAHAVELRRAHARPRKVSAGSIPAESTPPGIVA
jgi:hypothetical protein